MGLLRAAGTIQLNFTRHPRHRLKRPLLPMLGFLSGYTLITRTMMIRHSFLSTLIYPEVRGASGPAESSLPALQLS